LQLLIKESYIFFGDDRWFMGDRVMSRRTNLHMVDNNQV
jgi:hypothetical protein